MSLTPKLFIKYENIMEEVSDYLESLGEDYVSDNEIQPMIAGIGIGLRSEGLSYEETQSILEEINSEIDKFKEE